MIALRYALARIKMHTCSLAHPRHLHQLVSSTAAAFSVRRGIPPYSLRDHPEAIWSIQQQLIRDDAFLIGVRNLDTRDHARDATVTASSEISPSALSDADTVLDGRADNVVTGQSRAVVTDGGVPVGHGVNGTNRWISEPGALPAWISLQLRTPMRLSQVELTFDTGMHRKLAFNPVGKSDDAQPWGAQPETVKDYLVQGRDPASGKWMSLCNVTDNYQRKRIHRLPCAPPPSPAPAPPPAPVAAQGSIKADLCVASPSQMWAFDPALKQLYTTTTSGRLCLGFDAAIPAFGGEGKSVVARPCTPNSTAWLLRKPDGGAGRLLEVVGGSDCLNGPVCDTRKATAITISGAGTAAVNGVYKKKNESFSDGMPVFELDSSHQLYRYAGQWKLAHMGTGPVYYVADSHDTLGPPRGAASWSAESGTLPTPSHVGCDAAPPRCSCVHAVACAACHPTGTDGQVYIPPTSVELADCASSVTHIQWVNLTIAPGDGDDMRSPGGMLMSGGLCLGLVTTHNTTVESESTSASAPPLLHRASTPPSEEGVVGSVEVDAVRVVVTGTNGDPRAIINEVRLYEEDGLQPFPTPTAHDLATVSHA